jgi:hypothetical protein
VKFIWLEGMKDMQEITEHNQKTTMEILKVLLNETVLRAFNYNTYFTLTFERTKEGEYLGYRLPWEVEIQAHTDWWFGSKDEWYKRTCELAAGELMEPLEPVLAYDLTSLIWLKDSRIRNVELNDEQMEISLYNGKLITFSNKVDMDYSWIVQDVKVHGCDEDWSVVCESGEFYIRTPK